MTEAKQPEALRLANSITWMGTFTDNQREELDKAAAELRRLHAENEALASKLKVYEDLDEADSDVQLLRMGYAAARLEIESLRARIKTMAEERADELVVAHLDGRMRAGQPAGAQQSGAAYAELPECSAFLLCKGSDVTARAWNVDQMRAFADATHALRASHGQAPAQAAPAHPACKPDMLVNAGVALSDDLRDRLVAISEAVADQDDRAAQAMLREILKAQQPSPAPQADSQPAPVAQGDAMTYEREHAIRQGHEIASSDAYFQARPQIDGLDRRNVFRAGFERGWDAARSQAKEGA